MYYNNLNTKDISNLMGVANQTILNMLYQAQRQPTHRVILSGMLNLISKIQPKQFF